MIEGSENKTIGALLYEDIDIMTQRLNEVDLSDKCAGPIMIGVNQRADERGNAR